MIKHAVTLIAATISVLALAWAIERSKPERVAAAHACGSAQTGCSKP